MTTLTIRLPDDKHERLNALARSNLISVNKLVDELASVVLANYDAGVRFETRAARGNPKRALALLDKLVRAGRPLTLHCCPWAPQTQPAETGREPLFSLFGFGSGRSAAFVSRPLAGFRERRLCQTLDFRDQLAIDPFVDGPVVRLENRR